MSHNAIAEQSVIGSVLLEGSLIGILTLEPKHFYEARHKQIYEAMQQVADKEIEINVVTVVTELGNCINEVGGVSYLTDLAGSIPSTAPLKNYESAVYEDYRIRQSRILTAEYMESPNEEALHKLLNQLDKLKDEGIQTEEKTTQDYLFEIAEDMANPESDAAKGFPTTFKDYDNMTGGNQPGDLIIIAARPSVGKTAFALNIGAGHCKNGGVSHIYSLEMGPRSLLERMISTEGHVDIQKWRSMIFSSEDYDKSMNAIGEISNWGLKIHEKLTTINQIKASIRKNVQDNPDKNNLVIIDYLQLITSSGRHERRDLEVGAMTRDLKLLAQELNIPIILLSQLSRGVEQRQDKRPMMSDLRESGNIEQDADLIGFLYRDDYYDKETTKQNIIEIIISKQRQGPTGTVELAFIKEYGKFCDLDHRYS
ncbi:replicative DNA helicase [Microbulbifer pacificus]|uniref:replicative DNA helicase n=1 Tax=Microbulbifer pacificus TaxID=407164 RepID=UPI000CF4A2C0|nr:replicative DNA helicase [Microbulbifer pacificus]